VIDDLARLGEGRGRRRERRSFAEAQSVFVVDRNDEAALAGEVKAVKMVVLRLDDLGRHL
jgi:hypothetical protein